MKIRQVPNYLWSKHPYLTIASTVIGLSTIVVATFLTLGLGLLIPAITVGALFSIGIVAGLFKYRASRKLKDNTQVNLKPDSNNIPTQTANHEQNHRSPSKKFDPAKLLVTAKKGSKKDIEKNLDLFEGHKLIEAVEKGDLKTVVEILNILGSPERKIKVLNEVNDLGNTALLKAIILNKKEIVYEILNIAGLSVEQKMSLLTPINDFGHNALATAAKAGNSEIVSIILDSIPENQRSKLMNYHDTSNDAIANEMVDVIELAFNSEHQDTVKLLEKYGSVLPKVSAPRKS